jgi:hypothetical protein
MTHSRHLKERVLCLLSAIKRTAKYIQRTGVINSRAIRAGLHYYNGRRLVFRCTCDLVRNRLLRFRQVLMIAVVTNISEGLAVSIELDLRVGLA